MEDDIYVYISIYYIHCELRYTYLYICGMLVSKLVVETVLDVLDLASCPPRGGLELARPTAEPLLNKIPDPQNWMV